MKSVLITGTSNGIVIVVAIGAGLNRKRSKEDSDQ